MIFIQAFGFDVRWFISFIYLKVISILQAQELVFFLQYRVIYIQLSMGLLLRLHIEARDTSTLVVRLLMPKFQRSIRVQILPLDIFHIMPLRQIITLLFLSLSLLSLPFHLRRSIDLSDPLLVVRVVWLNLALRTIFLVYIFGIIGQELLPVGLFAFTTLVILAEWRPPWVLGITWYRRPTIVPEYLFSLRALGGRLVFGFVGLELLQRWLELVFILVHHWWLKFLNF